MECGACYVAPSLGTLSVSLWRCPAFCSRARGKLESLLQGTSLHARLAAAASIQASDDSADEDDANWSSQLEEEGVSVSIERMSRNGRRIVASVCIGSSLDIVWSVLTDYDGLADFIPGLASNEILERRADGARLLQIGEQTLALGVKFRAKGVMEVTEVPLELLSDGIIRRDINFDMVEGDFKIFRGTWRMQQCTTSTLDIGMIQTTLSYMLEVQPRPWLPVRLVEGRLAKEVKTNLACIRDRALDIWSSSSSSSSSSTSAQRAG